MSRTQLTKKEKIGLGVASAVSIVIMGAGVYALVYSQTAEGKWVTEAFAGCTESVIQKLQDQGMSHSAIEQALKKGCAAIMDCFSGAVTPLNVTTVVTELLSALCELTVPAKECQSFGGGDFIGNLTVANGTVVPGTAVACHSAPALGAMVGGITALIGGVAGLAYSLITVFHKGSSRQVDSSSATTPLVP